tara:strand:+ start:218 stop:469 length:252 start_codon:yes stop_codon:yes gene_type:complete
MAESKSTIDTPKWEQDSQKAPAWEKCEYCDEYQCNVHSGFHAHDCICPVLEVWLDGPFDPYMSPVTPSLRKWVDENPLDEEEM